MTYLFSWFRNRSVGTKLFGGFAILIIIIIISSIFSIQQSASIRDYALKGALVGEINDELNIARRNRLAYQINHDESAIQANKVAIDKMYSKAVQGESFVWGTEARVLFNDLRNTIPAYADARDNFVKFERQSVDASKSLTAPEQKSVLDKLNQMLVTHEQSTKQDLILLNVLNRLWIDVLQIQSSDGKNGQDVFETDYRSALNLLAAEGLQLTDADKKTVQLFLNTLKSNVNNYSAALQQSRDVANTLTGFAEKIANTIQNLVTLQTQKNLDITQQVITITALVAVCAVVVGLLVAWLITHQMTRQIRNSLTLAEYIASGDLTAVIEPQSSDELGRLTTALATMNQRLRDMISQIKESVMHVATASSEISAGNTDLASRTEEQSSAVVETAASMEELTSTVKRNADNAREASHLAEVAANHARSGGKIVWDVIETMGVITESSKKITEIISVINGISFQTNILALNAAVEAARAGEQGRGFAVVAGEVRNLAQRSAQAAKEIESLIQESVQRVHAGSEMANKAGGTMEQIISSVTNVSGIMNEISNASEEQSRGIDQIGKAVTELDSTTQQNAALVQESSSAASSLEQQADQLSQLVSVFKLGTESTTQHRSSSGTQLSGRLKTVALPPANNKEDWESF
ncbi:methyl-accepting chemotaxis protein [Pectobacterium quasiaquaticum]|uniref:Methyl-accepting chemotaxis protein n=1 Tax=Pectobacterium quasiaquaticum TaxID=2774015 RepID=A0A9Q2ET10_9GAMM|nr:MULTISPECIES: methyl-accepting chemotaxis protein [Pectobacterium]MBE5202262.1 methyl-accepting chemotaxis protein [Pectobacterium quasiaquaticum]MBE5209093.1 methyl-accepting chemotaxis protein [Pectobacterium quasiaquaticum]MBE5213193.1 methyl-accepting chemotaxis protein [Pectobacterium quasiaquaticum]MBE5221691.1 methyl-accepting chemotaxis protein [Pectobacterium quasiaquaticum]MBE5224157.1 methyl-accepting chemotaxis protein [Pectobacterium quasiaquaticum]